MKKILAAVWKPVYLFCLVYFVGTAFSMGVIGGAFMWLWWVSK